MISPETIEEVKKRLVETYNPIEIYLFGSYAWGTPDEESDLDLLIVVDESNEKSYNRTRPGHDALYSLDIAKDLIVYTKEEFQERSDNIVTLAYKIKKGGKRIYARA
jgi:uncharacterized protein